MRGKNYVSMGILIFLWLSIFCGVQPGYGQEVQEKHQVISLLPELIKPAVATISMGTTVIWANEAPGMVEIQFTNDQNMIVACGSPLRFIQDIEGQFISDMIPFAGIASICFIQKGTFRYTVKRVPSDAKAGKDAAKEYKGTIIVQ